MPPPEFNHATNGNRFIKAIGKTGTSVKLLLDCEKLLTDSDTEMLSEYQS